MTLHYNGAAASTPAARAQVLDFGTSPQVLDLPTTDLAAPSAAGSRGIYRRGAKRALDILIVLLSLPFTLPLMLAVALTVACNGGRPLYRQPRVGRGGRIYTIWKIRTMVPQAEKRLAQHLAADPAAQAEWNHAQKLRDDPRITPIGRFLRRSSLDELPQLWNVLRGDMSLVGPRPMMPQQRPLYPGAAYYRMQPGITGYWQISDRNRTSFSARADYDAAYEGDMSLRTDLRILFGTAGVVLRGTGL